MTGNNEPRWVRIAVGNFAATWRNQYGALLAIAGTAGINEEVSLTYMSEGRGFCKGRLTTIFPEEVPYLQNLRVTKIRREEVKFLRVHFQLRGITHVTEFKLQKKTKE